MIGGRPSRVIRQAVRQRIGRRGPQGSTTPRQKPPNHAPSCVASAAAGVPVASTNTATLAPRSIAEQYTHHGITTPSLGSPVKSLRGNRPSHASAFGV